MQLTFDCLEEVLSFVDALDYNKASTSYSVTLLQERVAKFLVKQEQDSTCFEPSKLTTIKNLKNITNLGLRECKELVDRFW